MSEIFNGLDAAMAAVLYVLIGLAAYRAYSVGASTVGIYRRQARWVASISVIAAAVFAIDFLYIFILPYNAIVDLIVSFLNNANILVLFGWIDNSTQISRRSDPLLRSIIGWQKVRKPIWGLLIACDLVVFPISIGVTLGGGNLAGPPPLSVLVALSVFLIAPFVLGAILIPVSSSRSRDPVFRRHLRWLSLFVLGLLGLVILFGSVLATGQGFGFLDLSRVVTGNPVTNVASGLLEDLLAFGLYKSAGSLVPTSKIVAD